MRFLTKYSSTLLFLSLAVLIANGQDKPSIKERFVSWGEDREQLSLDYLLQRHGLHLDSARIDPKIIVVHYTDNASVQATLKTFNSPRLAGRRDLQGASQLNVSSQFVVARSGQIYQLMPDNYFARHTIGLNYCAIGIENVGSARQPLTESQLEANVTLISYLKLKYPIQYVIGHYEYQLFKNTLWWRETNPTYITEKRDPGVSFMAALRKRLGMSEKIEVSILSE